MLPWLAWSSIYNPDRPQTQRELPAFAAWVLRLKVCATMPGQRSAFKQTSGAESCGASKVQGGPASLYCEVIPAA